MNFLHRKPTGISQLSMAASFHTKDDGQITQIMYMAISPDRQLSDANSQAGRKWSAALDLVQSCAGLIKLYWGRRLEEPEKIQLHLVWTNRQHSDVFLASAFASFQAYINDLIDNTTAVEIRHTALHHQALDDPFSPSLLGFPIGTAIYKGTSPAWHEGAWPLWTHVVRHVEGCRGIAGGSVEEAVEGWSNSYVVYVAWKSVKHHDDYHHTEHFQRHRVILGIGNEGWTEYGHVVFADVRYGRKAGSKL
ncbi:hypothetical protein BD289DRAFT_434155 [Coniella lustricola]|uniref:ABM domain-containing protein n=1 Tax=Coniella lustricola TaxID=2025994 RepID=A0A2T3A7V0_9PEZI|nr:hypothetical protein BD289DRAFT_434155 [Coniella lustricola]